MVAVSTPTIISVEWLDKGAEEAVVTVSDGSHSIRCFAHPFRGQAGAPVSSPVMTLDAEHFVRVTDRMAEVRAVGDFKHEIVGIVTQTSPPTVRAGEIFIKLDAPLPGDVKAGDLVEFVAERIDYVA
jgi:hypothetical protein